MEPSDSANKRGSVAGYLCGSPASPNIAGIPQMVWSMKCGPELEYVWLMESRKQAHKQAETL